MAVKWLCAPNAGGPRFDPRSGNQIPCDATKSLHAITKDSMCYNDQVGKLPTPQNLQKGREKYIQLLKGQCWSPIDCRLFPRGHLQQKCGNDLNFSSSLHAVIDTYNRGEDENGLEFSFFVMSWKQRHTLGNGNTDPYICLGRQRSLLGGGDR